MDAVGVFWRGDGGRDRVLRVAQRRGGLTRGEWDQKAGNMDYSAVFMAIFRFEVGARQDAFLPESQQRVMK